MAKFEPLAGAAQLEADFDKLGRLDDDKVWAILRPAAELVTQAMKQKVKSLFQQHTGKLADSIEAFPKRGDSAYFLVYPYGVHHKYNARLKTKTYKRSKHGRTYTTGGRMKNAPANDVGFILEYGDRKHKATHWMENTIKEQDAAITEAIQQGFDDLCDALGVGEET